MAKDDIVRNVQTLGDAARIVAQQHVLNAEALVEHYPSRYDRYSGIESSVPSRVFAYQFFDTTGGNCAYYLPELCSVHLFANPRRWGMPKPHWEPIGHLVSADAISAHA
jgi:hypothetical protein